MTFPNLPPPPNTSDPATFSARADAFFAEIPDWSADLAAYGNGISLSVTASSATSLAMPAAGASVNLTVDSSKGYATGMRVIVAATAAPSTQWFFATVTSYNGTTGLLALIVDFAIGTGTVSDWRVTVSQPYVTAPGAGGSSTTSLAMPAIGASVGLTASPLRTWQVGDTLQVVSTANPATVRFVGTVTAYNSGVGALTLTAIDVLGSGTVASWSIAPGTAVWGINGSSTTSLAMPAIGASVTLTASSLRTWQVGDTLQVVSTANPATVRFVGTVTAYNSGTGALTLSVIDVLGTGTVASWSIAPGTAVWGINGSSTTSLAMPAIGASVTLTASSLRTWQVGDTLQVVSTANPATVRFVGNVTAYNSGTGALTLSVVWARGTGTVANWQISPTANDALINAWTAINSAASVTLDLTTASYFTRTVNGATTFAFTGQPSGQAFGFTLEVVHTSGAITWPAAVVWPENAAPQLLINRVHVFVFVTDDGGVKWRGIALINYAS